MGLRSCHLCGRHHLFLFPFPALFRVLVLVLCRDLLLGLDLSPDRARVNVFLLVRHMAKKAILGIIDSLL